MAFQPTHLTRQQMEEHRRLGAQLLRQNKLSRGDYAGFIGREKTDGLNWSTLYGAWGDMSFQDGSYYTWNAQEGYMQFPSSLIAVPGDVLDGFYYAHGRWYMADIGLWLSPDSRGEYTYWGARQDPVNLVDPTGLCVTTTCNPNEDLYQVLKAHNAVPPCYTGTCGPDVTEWLMREMESQYSFGQHIRQVRESMKARSIDVISRFGTVGMLPSIRDLTIEPIFSQIAQEWTYPSSGVSIGSTRISDYATAIAAIEAMGILEYASYGLAVDFATFDYGSGGGQCGTGNCSLTFPVLNADNVWSEHHRVTLCDQCIDSSDLGNMIFGMGGAARGYDLAFTYGSAAGYNGLTDWLPKMEGGIPGLAKAMFGSPDGRGAIPGWWVGYTRSFTSKQNFCSIVALSEPLNWHDQLANVEGCAACNVQSSPSAYHLTSSLRRMSDDENTLDLLKNKLSRFGYR